jgi:type IX secretion system PorP/SprF family membrane protein
MKKILLSSIIFTILLWNGRTSGQDPNYSQWLNAPVYYNPAFTGLNTGVRARLSYRDQWPNLPVDYKTMYFSVDAGDHSIPGFGGLGLIINSDNESFGFIKNLSAGLTLSARIPFNAHIIGQVGIKGCFVQKRLNWNDFVFSDQMDEKYGNIYSTKVSPPDALEKIYPDFGAGGLIQFSGLEGVVIGTAGFAVDHIFQPDESFYATENSKLQRKYIGHFDAIITIGETPVDKPAVRGLKDPMKINPGILYQNQNRLSSVQFGVNMLKFNVYLGCYFQSVAVNNNSSSLMLMAGYRYIISDNFNIKFMYSYDMEVAGKMLGTGGAHEISLIFEFSKLQIFSKNRYEECPASPTKEIKFKRLECSTF